MRSLLMARRPLARQAERVTSSPQNRIRLGSVLELGKLRSAAPLSSCSFHSLRACTQRSSISESRLFFNPRYFSTSVDWSEVQMPALSPTMQEGNLVSWKKEEGEMMSAGDVMCEIETDKATVDFEVQDDAVLAKILLPEGSTGVKVGDIIAVTVEDEADYEKFVSEGGPDEVAKALGGGSGGGSASSEVAASAGSGKAAAVDKPQVTGRNSLINFVGKRSFAKPHPVAPQEWMTDYGKAPASASESAAASPAAAVDFEEEESLGYRDIPNSNMRKIIASRLTESKHKIPHAYASIDCELDSVLAMRKEWKSIGINVSLNDLILRAVALALRDVPEVNRTWVASKNEAVKNDSVDVSVAVATDAGLITPIVTDVDKKELQQVNADFRDLVGRARANKLKPEEFQGGSFTVSNLGGFGIDVFSAVINPPQAAILAVGGGRRVLVPAKGAPRAATLMTVQLSSDRRVVNESIGAEFLQCFKKYLDHPSLMLMVK